MAYGLDRAQVKKAVEALLAFASSKSKGGPLLLNENENFHLLVTVWKVPRVAQVIRIPLPHGIRPETAEVCLFTKDEPNLSAEQTENLYKKLLLQHGIRSVSQIISYKTLKKEYKMFEAKRRLLNRFDLFLSDDRIRRLLPSHLGKHFYERKKVPLSVNLKAKNLAKELQKHIQGTTLPVTNKGCCYTARVGHTGMKVNAILDNIVAAAEVIAKKLPKNWKNVKILHLKTLKSVALPIYTANLSNLDELDSQPSLRKKEVKKRMSKKPKKSAKKQNSGQVTSTTEINAAAAAQEPVVKEKVGVVQEAGDHNDEEIPQLVPMEITSLAELKAVEPSLEKGDSMVKKMKTPLGKRKKQPPALKTPKHEAAEECADLQTKQKKPKQLSMPKEAVKEMKKTTKKPEAKSFATSKAGKSIQSAKKSSKTPKQASKKVRKLQT
ncbi:ribosomal L1 domain-containing protein 1 [Pezoporus wallicus]|uniref:ribosomal L1 domain-containing protein 1 n=1 Tax=Pezoporus wallicus TaxID=35540 RepID=UPI00254DF71A|nr:ribosomal L1 domain-containing protein 1 [Pezoporus wallicus]XP_061329480.1 ribosomal L1 domain-containing protein 1 [Pezoporus flaviventris]